MKNELTYRNALRSGALDIFGNRLHAVLRKLDDRDIRILAFAVNPTLDKYVLGGWSREDITNEMLIKLSKNFKDVVSQKESLCVENIFDIAESIYYGNL